MSLICQLTSEDIKHQFIIRVPGEIKRREVELDPQPRRDHEQGGGAGLRKLDFFRFRLFLNSSATDIVLVIAQARQLKQQLRSALVAGQWRGDTALTLPLFWQRSTVSPVFFRAVSAVEPSLSRPLSPLSPPLISNLASVDVKQYGHGKGPGPMTMFKSTVEPAAWNKTSPCRRERT